MDETVDATFEVTTPKSAETEPVAAPKPAMWDGKPTMRSRIMAEPDWPTIEIKLRGGLSLFSIGKDLVTRPHMSDLNAKCLEKVLSRIRTSLARDGLKPAFGKHQTYLPIQFRAAVERLQGIPEVKQLAKLVFNQAKRVEIGAKLESTTKLLLPGVKEEMELLWKMQLSLIEVKQKLGLLHNEPLRMEALLGVVTGQISGEGQAEEKEKGPMTLDAASRQRVLQALGKMRKMIGPGR